MLIEQKTTYSYKLKYLENPSFDKVRNLAKKFIDELPKELVDDLYNSINRGVDILKTEPEMLVYLYSFGNMHQAKLNKAFENIPEILFDQPEINIIDYGCGQAIGTMCYVDFLKSKNYTQQIKSVTLIEPSKKCLRRAALHTSIFLPDAEITTVNKIFDELAEEDINCNEDVPTLHILSNVLDLEFNISEFTKLVKGRLKGYNQFLCVGPYFGYEKKDCRMEVFAELVGGDIAFSKAFGKGQFVEGKNWTCQVVVVSVGELEEDLSAEVTKKIIQDGVEDEFGVVYSRDGKRLLNGRNLKLECYEIKVGTEEICEDAFISNDWTLRQITIPDTVTIIGFRAFGWCHSLQQIIIPNSVKLIGDSAFIYCTSLRQVTMSNSITSIGEKVFRDCNALEQINIPNSVTKIGNEAFWGCKSLKQINIPDSVTLIGDSAFADCHYLQQITIPDSVTMIGKNPFVACWNLNITSNSSRFVIDNECLTDNHKIIISYFGKKMSIVIPDTVTKIGDSAFEVCSTLKHITIPETVTEIGNSAFLGCSMSQIEIPNSVKTLGYSVFRQCLSLQKITLSNSVTTISASAFYDCISLQRISIPDSVKAIDYGAFWGCRALQQIIIPESVTTIGDFAFRECKSLQKINIPNSVTTIGKCIFNRCDSLPPIIAYELFNRIGDNVVDQNIYSQKKTEHIRIKKIRIKNFRAFVDEEVYIDNFNCIIGKNDTGKSTILAALEWFFDVNKELNKNDLNAGDRDRYFGAALTQYDDTHAPHDIAVEVYFSGVEENNKDFIDNEGCVCIRKKMSYSTKNSKAYREMKYSIKKYSFRQMNGKVISECSFDELKYEYKKVASPSDKLWNKIQELEENEKNNNKNAECFKEREKTYGVDEDMYKFIEKLKPVEEQICEKLYLHYGNSEREEQWMDYIKEKEMEIIHWQIFSLMKEIVNSYKLNLYTSNTSLNNYLNDLLKIKYSASIEDTKSRMAKDLSKMLADNSVSESIRFEKNETINLFTTDNLLLSSGNIPLKNRGEGIQLQIKNAVFKILTGIQTKNQNTIFAFEEPETHLHPSAQIEMYETIKKMSENPNYQVFITTHSPYIVKQLAEDNIKPIVVKRDENLKVSTISKLEERVLPYVSMNEMNYIAFDEPSIEYHIELFGFMQNKLDKKVKQLDKWIKTNCNSILTSGDLFDWYNTETLTIEPDKMTLSYCVRNNIDHPLVDDVNNVNKHNAYENNKKFNDKELIRRSIEIMRNAIITHQSDFS